MKIYHIYQNQIQPGDLLVTFNRGNLLSKLIWWLSKRPNTPRASHIAFCLDKFEIVEATWSGMRRGSYQKYSIGKYDIVVVRPVFDFDPYEARRWASHQVGRHGYGFLQLLALAIKRIFSLRSVGDWDKNGLICSEQACTIYRQMGQQLFPYLKSCAEVTPVHYLITSKFSRIFDSRFPLER